MGTPLLYELGGYLKLQPPEASLLFTPPFLQTFRRTTVAISSQSRTIASLAYNQPTTLTPVQRAVVVAARAAWDFIGEEHPQTFAVIGGASFLFHGSDIRIEDTDLAVTI